MLNRANACASDLRPQSHTAEARRGLAGGRGIRNKNLLDRGGVELVLSAAQSEGCESELRHESGRFGLQRRLLQNNLGSDWRG